MDAPNLVAIFGVLTPFMVQMLKEAFPKVNPRIFSIGLCFLIGFLYALTQEFIPQEFVVRIAAVGGTTFAIATSLYKLQK